MARRTVDRTGRRIRLAGLFLACGMLAGAPAAGEEVTFTGDVAPILWQHCVECHRPGSFAPMSLLDYETAKRYAGVIKFRVQERLMPPWHIDKNVGVQAYKNDVSLSDDQIETIARWVDAGAPRGPGDPPPAPHFPKGGSWQLEAELQRPPDLVVRSSPYDVQPNGQDQWWGPAVPVEGIDEPRWIQAYEFKPSYPGGMKVVHHGHAYYRTSGSGRGLAIAHYGVGKRYEIFPQDVGMLLPAGEAVVTWNLHYAPFATTEAVPGDVAEVGLWFHPEGATPRIETAGEVLFRVDRMGGMPRGGDILIPPNSYKVIQGVHTLDRPALIQSFRPHMHARGKEMSLEALYPDGRREMLGKIDNYRHNWQITYLIEEGAQPLLPKGTTLLFTSVFDNTAANEINPDPNQWVVFGRRGVDEMSHMWVGISYLEEEQYQMLLAEQWQASSR